MYRFLFYAHSGWRWLVIGSCIVAACNLLHGAVTKRERRRGDKFMTLMFPLALDIQLLLGVTVWIAGQHWRSLSVLRSWEHPVTMIVVLLLAHGAFKQTKSQDPDTDVFRKAFIRVMAAAVLMAFGIWRISGN